jgi:transposase
MERRKFTREFKLEAVRLIKDRGVSYVQASQDLNVHPSQLRDWVKKLSEDPQHAFPGHGQMKPEQLEIVRLKREVAKLKAERDILLECAHGWTPCVLAAAARYAGLHQGLRRRRCAARLVRSEQRPHSGMARHAGPPVLLLHDGESRSFK